jgi:hypothetical protein
MRRIALALGASALLAAGASTTATAAEVPPINCGIVSCTHKVEQALEHADQCVEGAKRGIEYIVQGTPQPQECNLP